MKLRASSRTKQNVAKITVSVENTSLEALYLGFK